MTDFSKYEDMLYRERPVSHRHPPMDLMDRASQFSPFAALTGYGDAVKETARQTEQRRELDEYEKAALDEKLRELEAQMRPRAAITYFVPDDRKEGGSYRTVRGVVKKIDHAVYRILLELEDGAEEQIPIEEILLMDTGRDFRV